MTTCKKNKRFSFIALMTVIVAIFFFMGAKAKVYAYANPENDTAAVSYTAETVQETPKETYSVSEPVTETPLTVKEVWLSEDTLHIYVVDGSGDSENFELNLSDYATPDDEYVTVQATDSSGRKSNSVTFKNPYSIKPAETSTDGGESDTDGQGESDVPDNGLKPFTPDGTGTVVDNVSEKNGKEFFSIETPDGNVFYLIVDRQRNSENVYLLNAVTEQSLASLAKSGDGKTVSAVETPPQIVAPPAQTEPASDDVPIAPEPKKKDNKGTMAFICILALAVGGAGYYFKIVRPKKDGAFTPDFEQDDYENGETDLEDDEDNYEEGDNE